MEMMIGVGRMGRALYRVISLFDWGISAAGALFSSASQVTERSVSAAACVTPQMGRV